LDVAQNVKHSVMNTYFVLDNQTVKNLELEIIPHILQQHKWHGSQIPG
jgi:hypothetical protein